jgi:hypothetical protein
MKAEAEVKELAITIGVKDAYPYNPYTLRDIKPKTVPIMPRELDADSLAEINRANIISMKALRDAGIETININGKKHKIETFAIVEKDPTSFTKIYDVFWNILPNLSKGAVTVISHIMNHCLTFNRDLIVVDPNLLEELDGVNQRTYYRAVKDLINNGILARSTYGGADTFWINVNVVFKGNRYLYYQEKKEHEKKINRKRKSFQFVNLLNKAQ